MQGVLAINENIGEASIGGIVTGVDTFFLIFAVSEHVPGWSGARKSQLLFENLL